MNNFKLQIPTKIIFGRDTHLQVGSEVSEHSKNILLVRIKKRTLENMGLYEDIITSLDDNNIKYIELEDIKPNPLLGKVREGAEICKREKIDFVLAVGGGSVIDTAKAIAAAACIEEDYWDIVTEKVPFKKSLKIGTVVTMPATGSEMNTSCVITNDETLYKKGSSLAHPTFSILNPDVCKTLPKNRKAQGVVDILAHAMERYFTNTEHVELTDRMLEGLMKNVVIFGEKFYNDDFDYDVSSQIMYSSTVAHNFTLCVGRVTDFASHRIGHGLSGIYDLPHGDALSIIFPAWFKYVRGHGKGRIMKFFESVFNVEPNYLDMDEAIDRGIKTLEEFYKKLDMPIRISDTYIKDFNLERTLDMVTEDGKITHGGFVRLGKDDIRKIYELAE